MPVKLTNPEIIRLIQSKAEKRGLPADIVYGIVKQESAFNPFASRYESAWSYFVDPRTARPPGCSIESEKMLQKFSYGLMQVMGSVLREHGFIGWLPEIYSSIELQIEYGTKHLAKFVKRYGLQLGVSAYNCGTPDRNKDGKPDNPEYVKNVFTYAEEWDELINPSE